MKVPMKTLYTGAQIPGIGWARLVRIMWTRKPWLAWCARP